MSKETNERFTPRKYLDSVRKVFGGVIDLDPFSSIHGNKRIKAIRFFSKENPEEWHTAKWIGNVFCNPPYSRGYLYRVVNKMYSEDSNIIRTGSMNNGILLVPNWTERSWFQFLLNEYPVCLTNHRIEYLKYVRGQFFKMKNPENGSAFFYFGINIEGFTEEFSKHGKIVVNVDKI